MEKTSPDTYLTGQPLKANTFGELLTGTETGIPPIVPDISSGANRSFAQTTANQEKLAKEQEFLAYLVRPIPKNIRLKPVPTLRARQVWEGTVLERQGNSFVARVNDRTNPSNPDEIVTFELDEISQEDQKLAEPGFSFYWTIGTERSPAGQIRNIAMVNFRRLPYWTTSSVREAEQEAKSIVQQLFSE